MSSIKAGLCAALEVMLDHFVTILAKGRLEILHTPDLNVSTTDFALGVHDGV